LGQAAVANHDIFAKPTFRPPLHGFDKRRIAGRGKQCVLSERLGEFMIDSKRVVAVVVFGATFGIGSASAADLAARPYTKAPVYAAPPVSFPWTGCYIGGNVGGGWDRFNAGELAFAGVPTPLVDYGSNRGSSVIGGGQIGCDYQFASNWVVGIQGQADFGTIHSSNDVVAFPGITADFKLKNIETLTGRVGYTVSPAVLAYVKGGAAWANASAAAAIPNGLIGESAKFTMTGYTVGGGLEWMFAPGWSVFGEYNYMNFGTKSVNFTSTGIVPGFGAAGTLADTNAIKLTAQNAIVGVNYKFNWANAGAARY
jgi:outer membrane immunogenic protein